MTAREAARAWMHGYGIATGRYTSGGGDHPMMDTLPAAFEAFAAARPAPAGDAEEVARLRSQVAVEVDAAVVQSARFQRLLIAFHDATRRPLGVTPASGDEFYDWRLAEMAEEHRPRHGTEGERRERPEVRLVAAQREKAAAETALAEARAALQSMADLFDPEKWASGEATLPDINRATSVARRALAATLAPVRTPS